MIIIKRTICTILITNVINSFSQNCDQNHLDCIECLFIAIVFQGFRDGIKVIM